MQKMISTNCTDVIRSADGGAPAERALCIVGLQHYAADFCRHERMHDHAADETDCDTEQRDADRCHPEIGQDASFDK